MLPPPTYYILLTLCWMYALLRGAAPERVGATIMTIGSAVTVLATSGPPNRFGAVEIGIFIVDSAVLAAFAILALRSDRFWPIWASAFVGLGVLGHLARWLAGPDIGGWAYATSIIIWSYPALATIAVGTLNHQRRVWRPGADKSQPG